MKMLTRGAGTAIAGGSLLDDAPSGSYLEFGFWEVSLPAG